VIYDFHIVKLAQGSRALPLRYRARCIFQTQTRRPLFKQSNMHASTRSFGKLRSIACGCIGKLRSIAGGLSSCTAYPSNCSVMNCRVSGSCHTEKRPRVVRTVSTRALFRMCAKTWRMPSRTIP